MRRVALVTAAAAKSLDEDLPPLIGALGRLGIAAEAVIWDDTRAEWAAYDLAVVRSTWDYSPRREEFVAWAERAAKLTRVANPPSLLRWNTDKRYLGDLAARGIPIVPTRWIAPGEPLRLPDDEPFVIKPSVGAGAMDTARHLPGDAAAAAHVERLHATGRTAMIQPYLDRIDGQGETGLIYMGGVYSHSIRKSAMLRTAVRVVSGLYSAEETRSCEPSPAERELADRVMREVPGTLYARVDLAPGPDGSPLLLELEITEPSLFLNYAPGAADRLASAIASWR